MKFVLYPFNIFYFFLMRILGYVGVPLLSFAFVLGINISVNYLVDSDSSFFETSLSLRRFWINLISAGYYFCLLKIFYTCYNLKPTEEVSVKRFHSFTLFFGLIFFILIAATSVFTVFLFFQEDLDGNKSFTLENLNFEIIISNSPNKKDYIQMFAFLVITVYLGTAVPIFV
jgi:hypothetical protein